MPRRYHAIGSKFAAGPLADFCATYYVVITTFGNHWDKVRADNFELLKDLPPKKYGKQCSYRLFCLRRYIQKGLELMQFSDYLKLRMFDLPREKLRFQHSDDLEGLIIDAWPRQQGEESRTEIIIYTNSSLPVRHVSIPTELTDRIVDARRDEHEADSGSLRLSHTLKLTGYEDVLYVSRLHIPNRQHARLRRSSSSSPLRTLTNLMLPAGEADVIAQSLCSSTSGDLTFELFCLYGSDDPRHLSELCYYNVELLTFGSRVVDPESHLQAQVTCTDPEGANYTYRAEWNKIRRLSQGEQILALTKRIWNSEHRFILTFESADEELRRVFLEQAQNNLANLRRRYVFTGAEELLELLPQEGDEIPVGELSIGQCVVHQDYGPGMVDAFEDKNGVSYARFHFQGRRFDSADIFIPTDSKLSAYWTDLILL